MLGKALELEMSHLMSCFQMTGRFVTLGNGKIFHRIVRDPNDTGGQSAASDVAATAKDEARAVQNETMDQVKSLASNAQDELTSQASTQQQRLAEQSRTVTDDLRRISRGERPESQMVTQAVSSIADRAESLTRQLETIEPMDLRDDVRPVASRRPDHIVTPSPGNPILARRTTSAQ